MREINEIIADIDSEIAKLDRKIKMLDVALKIITVLLWVGVFVQAFLAQEAALADNYEKAIYHSIWSVFIFMVVIDVSFKK